MPKTSRPDRKRSDRRTREPKEYEETTLSVDRVTRVVKGGRRLRFRAVVVLGNKKGKVGLGTGKATEVQVAVQKATADAKRNMIRVPIVNGTIPHEVDTKFKAARIRLLPASEGTGIIAGGALRVILEHAGVQNVLSKRYGTGNKLVNAQASMRALQELRGVPPNEQDSSVSVEETKQMKEARQDAEALAGEQLTVKEVRREDVVGE
ncbi:30S ribosomal protein S5 [Candidatus Peregrinibacteria bacterium CG10_big_fil_rev_8_21_14_0_10_55_24]|nr:MAG: 30S ribosomal protein S5 [Candidatus Peregrinibacteria bacterium CG10_big_fil_rev_8_21_14_0_10_55_24]